MFCQEEYAFEGKMFCQGGKCFFEVEYVLSGKIMFCQEENVFEGRNVLRSKENVFEVHPKLLAAVDVAWPTFQLHAPLD